MKRKKAADSADGVHKRLQAPMNAYDKQKNACRALIERLGACRRSYRRLPGAYRRAQAPAGGQPAVGEKRCRRRRRLQAFDRLL